VKMLLLDGGDDTMTGQILSFKIYSLLLSNIPSNKYGPTKSCY